MTSDSSHNIEDPSYFDTAYRDYEAQNPRRKLDHYLDVVEDVVDSQPIDLLDVGCGLGAFLEAASMRHPEWLLSGFDSNPTGIAEARRRCPGASIHQFDAEDVALEPQSYDVVTAFDVLEHVPELKSIESGIETALRPGGSLVFVVPVYGGLTGPIIRRLDKDPTHVHKKSRQWWLSRAADAYDSVSWHGIFRYLIPGGPYLHIPTHRFKNHAPAIMVTATKR